MQVEARHHRHVRADHLAHAAQDLALTVVVMLGHHRAVQVEIDAVDAAGRAQPRDQVADDPLERVLGHRCRAPLTSSECDISIPPGVC